MIDLGPDGARFPRDADGMARGGIRLPQVEVPVAALSGDPGPVDTLMCQLLGQTLAFTGRAPRRARTRRSRATSPPTRRPPTPSIAAGFALADDRDEILADAHPEVIPA